MYIPSALAATGSCQGTRDKIAEDGLSVSVIGQVNVLRQGSISPLPPRIVLVILGPSDVKKRFEPR